MPDLFDGVDYRLHVSDCPGIQDFPGFGEGFAEGDRIVGRRIGLAGEGSVGADQARYLQYGRDLGFPVAAAVIEGSPEGLTHICKLLRFQFIEHDIADHDAGVGGCAHPDDLPGGGKAVSGQCQRISDQCLLLQKVIPHQAAGTVGQLTVAFRILDHSLEKCGRGHHLTDDVQRRLYIPEGHRHLSAGLLQEILDIGKLILSDLCRFDRHGFTGDRFVKVLELIGHGRCLAVQPDILSAEGRGTDADAVPRLQVIGHIRRVIHALCKSAQLKPEGQFPVPALPAVHFRHAEAAVHQYAAVGLQKGLYLFILLRRILRVPVKIKGGGLQPVHLRTLGIS